MGGVRQGLLRPYSIQGILRCQLIGEASLLPAVPSTLLVQEGKSLRFIEAGVGYQNYPSFIVPTWPLKDSKVGKGGKKCGKVFMTQPRGCLHCPAGAAPKLRLAQLAIQPSRLC